MKRIVLLVSSFALAAALAGCAQRTLASTVEVAMESDATRAQLFEATLTALDEHPEYVDELVQRLLAHPGTLDRALADSAHELADAAFAAKASEHIVREPEAIRRVVEATVDRIGAHPEAVRALLTAVQERSPALAELLSRNPKTLSAVVRSLLAAKAKETPALLRELVGGGPRDGGSKR